MGQNSVARAVQAMTEGNPGRRIFAAAVEEREVDGLQYGMALKV